MTDTSISEGAAHTPEQIDAILRVFDDKRHDLRIFMNGVVDYLVEHPALTIPGQEVIHSFKRRLKNPDHLAKKSTENESETG